MAANLILFDFTIKSTINNIDQFINGIELLLKNTIGEIKQIYSCDINGDYIKIYNGQENSLLTIRYYTKRQLVTLNIEYYKNEQQEALITFERAKLLETEIGAILDARRTKTLPALKRGAPINVYMNSSDDRILEYDIDKVEFDERSPYQRVQIVHSKTFGNMLVLDDLQNLAESDLIYTETLMARGQENYKNKEIVILGGGDGALLYELLKEEPKEVIMLELDKMVMEACAKHMRSVCGDVLDKMEGDHYKIIVGDCMETINQYISDGRKFDYVFGDLTDIPISETATGPVWEFINKVLKLSLKILKPNGKYMTHIIGIGSTDALKMYEDQLKAFRPEIKYTITNNLVPSFLEDWVFCQISLK